MGKKSNAKVFYTVLGVAALLLAAFGGVRFYTAVSKLFLPTPLDFVWLAVWALCAVACLVMGIRFSYIGIKTGVAVKKHLEETAANKNKTTLKTELSEAASNLPEAASQISDYLTLKKEDLFRLDLLSMQGTVIALEEMFNMSRQAVSRRFLDGLTATKFQAGLDSLYNAILARLNKQMLQLCAVNIAELIRRAAVDTACRESIEKLKAYISGTKTLLDKTMGLGARLTLELIDCTEDVLQAETEHLTQLTAELEAYKR